MSGVNMILTPPDSALPTYYIVSTVARQLLRKKKKKKENNVYLRISYLGTKEAMCGQEPHPPLCSRPTDSVSHKPQPTPLIPNTSSFNRYLYQIEI